MKINKSNKYLIFGFLLMSFASYYFAVRKTFELRKDLNAITAQQKSFENVQALFSQLTKRESDLDKELTRLNLDNTSLQNGLLTFLSEQSIKNGFGIQGFNAPHVARETNSERITQMFVVDGNYNSILRTLNELENHGGFGKVSHINFEKKKNFKNNSIHLQASIYLEILR